MLSEERQSMEWVGIFQVRILWVEIFRRWGGISTGEFDEWELFSLELLEPFSSYDVSILVFQKIYQHYIKQTLYLSTNIKRLSTKRHILETHKISRKNSLPQLFCFNQREIFSTQNT